MNVDIAIWSPLSSSSCVVAASDKGQAWADTNVQGTIWDNEVDLSSGRVIGTCYSIAPPSTGDIIRAALAAGLIVGQCNSAGRVYGLCKLEADNISIAIAPFDRHRDRHSVDAWTEE